jgi:hypothetical protein
MIEISDERITEAVEDGVEAFWAVIAKQFPEVTSGDFPPDAEFALTKALEEAVRVWLDANVESDDEQNDIGLVN